VDGRLRCVHLLTHISDHKFAKPVLGLAGGRGQRYPPGRNECLHHPSVPPLHQIPSIFDRLGSTAAVLRWAVEESHMPL
jgi:hypothetical protein